MKDIPPMPSRWTGTQEDWVAYRRAGDDAVAAYWNALAQTPSVIETDSKGNPVISIAIDPTSGMAVEAPPSVARRLFSRKP